MSMDSNRRKVANDGIATNVIWVNLKKKLISKSRIKLRQVDVFGSQ